VGEERRKMKKKLRKKQKKANGTTAPGPWAGSSASAGTSGVVSALGSLTIASPLSPSRGGAAAVVEADGTDGDTRVWTLQLLREGSAPAFATAPDGGVALFDCDKDARQYCLARGWTALAATASLMDAMTGRCGSRWLGLLRGGGAGLHPARRYSRTALACLACSVPVSLETCQLCGTTMASCSSDAHRPRVCGLAISSHHPPFQTPPLTPSAWCWGAGSSTIPSLAVLRLRASAS
jgi:hypothetical protein